MDWQPIQTIPCRDELLMVRYRDADEFITDVDHDSFPDWWAAQGATHWRKPNERELEAYYTLAWK